MKNLHWAGNKASGLACQYEIKRKGDRFWVLKSIKPSENPFDAVVDVCLTRAEAKRAALKHMKGE